MASISFLLMDKLANPSQSLAFTTLVAPHVTQHIRATNNESPSSDSEAVDMKRGWREGALAHLRCLVATDRLFNASKRSSDRDEYY